MNTELRSREHAKAVARRRILLGGAGHGSIRGQGAVSGTSPGRQNTSTITGEEQRRAVAFSTGHLKPRGEGSCGRRRGF